MKEFYVYAHLRPDFTPFYIGKGSGNRSHRFDKRNVVHKRIVAKYGAENIIIEVMPCKSEAEAFLREQLAINALRISGILLANLTDGGEGSSGLKHSESVRVNQSKRANQQWSNVGYRQSRSLETKALWNDPAYRSKTSLAHKGQQAWNKGKYASIEHRAKLSLAHQGLPWSPARRLAYENKYSDLLAARKMKKVKK